MHGEGGLYCHPTPLSPPPTGGGVTRGGRGREGKLIFLGGGGGFQFFIGFSREGADVTNRRAWDGEKKGFPDYVRRQQRAGAHVRI